MATQQTRALGRIAVAPSVLVLLLWMLVPLGMTIWFSFLRYNLLDPNPACSLVTPGQLLDEANRCLAGTTNYYYFLTDPAFFKAMANSLLLVFWVLVISVAGGTLLALLLDQAIYGRNFVRLMVIAPFFVMPPVAASIWENLFMHPQNGLFSAIARGFGMQPILFLEDYPLMSVIGIVSWEWLPFATLIFLTALVGVISQAFGIDSVMKPMPGRVRAWERIARDLPLDRLETMIRPTTLAELPALGAAILKGEVQGRVVVDVTA